MTSFNPMDPVHAAAKDLRDVVKAIYDARFDLQPDQFARQAARLKRQAIDRMRDELSRGHITTDKIHNHAYQLLRALDPRDPEALQARENELVGVLEIAMIDAGMKLN